MLEHSTEVALNESPSSPKSFRCTLTHTNKTSTFHWKWSFQLESHTQFDRVTFFYHSVSRSYTKYTQTITHTYGVWKIQNIHQHKRARIRAKSRQIQMYFLTEVELKSELTQITTVSPNTRSEIIRFTSDHTILLNFAHTSARAHTHFSTVCRFCALYFDVLGCSFYLSICNSIRNSSNQGKFVFQWYNREKKVFYSFQFCQCQFRVTFRQI